MHVIMPCPQCGTGLRSALKSEDDLTTSLAKSNPFPTVEVDRWPFYEHACSEGHRTRMTIQNELYELLFQQAVYCIQDGYYREAVGTFHASLERFMEFATEILSYKVLKDIDFDAIWKTIGNQSERQLGAYLIAYQLVLGKLPQKLDGNRVKLRNNVVHKGRLVTKKEAICHGQYVMDYIKAAMTEIRESLAEDEFAYGCSRRLARICRQDIVHSYADPIKIETPEGTMRRGVSQTLIPIFLSGLVVGGYTEYETVKQCLKAGCQLGLIK